MTSQVFYGYVANNLLPFLKAHNTTFPVLFLVDGHKSHISYEVAMFCKENDIILYSLLPNATHILQPADVSVFKPIKSAWKKIVSDWLKQTRNKTVTRANFPLIESALMAATEDILQNGFRKCGLFPFDKENIYYSKCLSHESRVVDKPCQFKTEHLLFLESVCSSSCIQQFRCSGERWCGDESAKELFHARKTIKDYISSQDKSAEPPGSSNIAVSSTSNHPDLAVPSTSNCTDLAIPSAGNHPDLTSDDQPVNQVNQYTFNDTLVEANHQPTTQVKNQCVNLKMLSPSPVPEMECVTSKSGRSVSGVSPAFSECVVWPAQSPIKKLGNSRKKLSFPMLLVLEHGWSTGHKRNKKKYKKKRRKKNDLKKETKRRRAKKETCGRPGKK